MNRVFSALLLLFSLTLFAQEPSVPEPPQLAKLRVDFVRARLRDTSTVTTKYLRDLDALKQKYARESKIEAGAAVEREIRNVMEAGRPKPKEGAVPKGPRITVKCYIEENYKGREFRIEGPAEYVTAAAAGIPNDKLASMKIPPGFAVTVFGNASYKGNSGRYTGDVPTLGEMLGKTTSLTITRDQGQPAAGASGGDAPELTTLAAEYQTELKRVSAPAVAAYRRNLQTLKEQFTHEAKMEPALSVERELQRLSEE